MRLTRLKVQLMDKMKWLQLLGNLCILRVNELFCFVFVYCFVVKLLLGLLEVILKMNGSMVTGTILWKMMDYSFRLYLSDFILFWCGLWFIVFDITGITSTELVLRMMSKKNEGLVLDFPSCSMLPVGWPGALSLERSSISNVSICCWA